MPVPSDALEEDIEMRYLSMAEVDKLPITGEERQEYLTAALHTQIAATIVNGTPVSLCYAGATTESLWDMSLETLEPFQHRGYAALCAAFTIDQMGRQRKRPVWGALDSNTASLQPRREARLPPGGRNPGLYAGLGGGLRPLRLDQLAAQDLPRGSLRYRLHELDLAHLLVGRHALLDKAHELVGAGLSGPAGAGRTPSGPRRTRRRASG